MSIRDAVKDLPPLLALLELGARSSERGAKSADAGIPIDAQAVEIRAGIMRTLKDWAGQVQSFFVPSSAVETFNNWAHAFSVIVVPDSKIQETTVVLESWVQEITDKYDPPRKVEWKSPCPRCGVLHVTEDGIQRFAVVINVTDKNAECVNPECGERFEGRDGLALLRLLANVAEQVARGEKPADYAWSQYCEYHGVSDVA